MGCAAHGTLHRRAGRSVSGAPAGGVESNAFSPADYQAMLAEVREHLPLFLAPAASERHDPLGDVQGLTGLHPEDLRRVIATHICLSEEVTAFVGALPDGLRRPVTSSIRPREVT